MNPLRILLAALRACLMLLVMALILFPYLLLSTIIIQHTHEKAYWIRRKYVRFCNFILGIKVALKGNVHDQPALYVSNHRSFSDPFILLKYLDAYVIAKAEVANMPMIHTGASLTGIIYVERDNRNSRSEVRQALVDTIRSDLNVLVYPEGTTNPFKKLIEYRPGTFMEAAKHGIPVVPVVLEYRDRKDIWFNRGLAAQFFRQFGHWRTHTKLTIGPSMTDTDGLKLRDKVQDWSQHQVNEMHKNWNSVFEYGDDAR